MAHNKLYKDGIHNLKLDEIDMEALLDILRFAGETAAFLAHREASSGRAGKELIRLARLANDSNDFLKYISDSLEIGEPDANSLN
jgi:hypothetical protein